MSNPVLSKSMNNIAGCISDTPMTVQGALNKLFLMFALLSVSFGVVFYQYSLGFMDKVKILTLIGAIAGFLLAMIIIFSRKAMNVLVPLYAFAEGMVLGGFSAVVNAQIPGIVPQAVVLTFLSLFAMLVLFKTGAVRATEKFKSTVIISTMAIGIFYLISMVLSFAHISVPLLYSSSIFGIGFSLVVCVVASLNLILDFDFIENGEMMGLDKTYEWYGVFGLMVTLVWLYIEILNLLAKLNRR